MIVLDEICNPMWLSLTKGIVIRGLEDTRFTKVERMFPTVAEHLFIVNDCRIVCTPQQKCYLLQDTEGKQYFYKFIRDPGRLFDSFKEN